MKFLLRLIVVALLSTPAMADPTTDAAKAVELGQAAEAEQRWEDAANHYAEAARLEPNFNTFTRLVSFCKRLGDDSAGQFYTGQLLEIARAGDDVSLLILALNHHAYFETKLKRLSEAENLYREVVELARQHLGTDHPSYLVNIDTLASFRQLHGDFVEAEALYREALEATRASNGYGRSLQHVYLIGLAELWAGLGRYDEAEQLMLEAIQFTEAEWGSDHLITQDAKSRMERLHVPSPPQ